MIIDRVRAWIPVGSLTIVAFVLAHEATFLVTHGQRAEEALALSGHGRPWTATVAVVLVGGALLAFLAIVRLIQLTRQAQEHAIRSDGVGDALALMRSWARMVVFILPASLLLFVVEENLEHVTAGLPFPGLDVLGSGEYGWAPMVFAIVTTIVALVGALYRWKRAVLEARLAGAPATDTSRRASKARRRPFEAYPTLASVAGRKLAVRGPPVHIVRGCAGRV